MDQHRKKPHAVWTPRFMHSFHSFIILPRFPKTTQHCCAAARIHAANSICNLRNMQNKTKRYDKPQNREKQPFISRFQQLWKPAPRDVWTKRRRYQHKLKPSHFSYQNEMNARRALGHVQHPGGGGWGCTVHLTFSPSVWLVECPCSQLIRPFQSAPGMQLRGAHVTVQQVPEAHPPRLGLCQNKLRDVGQS